MSCPRLVAITDPGHMFDSPIVQGYLEVPQSMDLMAEVKAWFAAGGDSNGTFTNYLLARGAKPYKMETFVIPYM